MLQAYFEGCEQKEGNYLRFFIISNTKLTNSSFTLRKHLNLKFFEKTRQETKKIFFLILRSTDSFQTLVLYFLSKKSW